MANGVIGLVGIVAQQNVMAELKQEHEHVQTLHQVVEEQTALVQILKLKVVISQ